jgi:hypothetical protein
VLGVTEVAISVLLVSPTPIAVAGCSLAGLLSLGFAVVSVAALRRGERFTCACLYEREQLSWATALRALAMVLAAVIGGLGPMVYRPVTGTTAVMNALALTVIAIGVPWTARLVLRIWAVTAEGRGV